MLPLSYSQAYIHGKSYVTEQALNPSSVWLQWQPRNHNRPSTVPTPAEGARSAAVL